MDSFTNIPDDVGYDLFRCGYWLVNITSCGEIKRDVIIYIKVHVDNEIYFFHCFTAKDLDREDATGHDLFLINISDVTRLPVGDVLFRQPLFAITMGRYVQQDNWGPYVYALASEPIYPDDEDVLFNDLTRFRRAIQDNLTAHIPQKRPKRITIPFSNSSFINMMSFGLQEYQFANKRVGQLVYQPTPGQDAPTPEEYGLVMWVLKVTAPVAFRQVADAKREAKPIIFKCGEMTNLQARRRRLIKQYPGATKTEIKRVARYIQESLKVKFVGDEIKALENCIGPFASKKPKNATVPTRFIEARREGDPDHFKGCTMTLQYLPAKASLQADFTFVIRNTAGDLN